MKKPKPERFGAWRNYYGNKRAKWNICDTVKGEDFVIPFDTTKKRAKAIAEALNNAWRKETNDLNRQT